MIRNIFHPDSGLMVTMDQITDCVFLSLFWLLGCIPVVTVGASCAALYDASFRAFRKGEKHSWQRFFSTYRENLKASLVSSLVFLSGAVGLGKCLIGIWNAAAAGDCSWMVFSAAAMAAMLPAGILSLVFPVLSRFENNTWGLLKNAVLLGMANMPRTLALGILNTAALLLCMVYVIPVFFLPALTMLLNSFLIEPMFKPYLPEETE